MGREIKGGHFEQRDFDRFSQQLLEETERLRELLTRPGLEFRRED